MNDEEILNQEVESSLSDELHEIQNINKQASAETSKTKTKASNTNYEFSYATFGSRFFAISIDIVIIYIIYWLIALITMNFERNIVYGYYSALSLSIYIIFILYFSSMHTWKGQTIGKMLMHIKVINTNGKSISFGRAIIRSIFKVLSGYVLFIGFLSMLWDKKKQTWHDHIAKTLVIKLNN